MNAQNALVTDIVYLPQSLRLPYPEQLAPSFQIDNVGWKVLTDTIFPHAKEAESIVMALASCRRRNLDIFKKPVHIVPMYSTVLKRMVDTIWPSISELRTTAARTGSYAGKDETAFGPLIKKKLGNTEIEFPEWAQVTVYRIVQNVRCPFVGPKCHWLEYYAVAERYKKDPNDRWQRATHGQIEKCAEAGALRAAFPEEIGNDYAAEEMEGQVIIDAEATTAPAKRVPPPAPPREPPAAARPPEKAKEPDAPAQATTLPDDGKKVAGDAPHPIPAYKDGPTAFLEALGALAASSTSIEELDAMWNEHVDPISDDMDQPSYEQAMAFYRKNERRFEP